MDNAVDLGKSYDSGPSPVKSSSKGKKSYPTLYISDVEGLDDLPDGVFDICGTAKVVSRTETDRNGIETCSYEVEIQSFGPCEPMTDESEGLDGAMKKIAKKKMVADTDNDNE